MSVALFFPRDSHIFEGRVLPSTPSPGSLIAPNAGSLGLALKNLGAGPASVTECPHYLVFIFFT